MRILLSVVALLLMGAVWPTNIVTVSDNAGNPITECNGANDPYDCCTANDAGSCVGNGLESDDIWKGLLTCAFGSDRAPGGVLDTGGCILDLPAGTFTSPEVTISDQAHVDGRSGRSLAGTTPFPNGLIVRGKGRATKLLSSIPPPLVTASNFNSMGIFFIGNFDPPVGDYAISRMKFEDFECDGQSPLQPAAPITAAGYGLTAESTRHFLGFQSCISTRFGEGQTIPRMVIQNIYSHDFIGTQIELHQVDSALVTNNLIENTGCIQDVDHTICDAPGGGGGPNEECSDIGRCVGLGDPYPCCSGAGTGSCDDLTDRNTAEACCNGGPNNHTCTPLLCCTGAGTGCDTYMAGDENSGWFLGEVEGSTNCGCSSGQPDCYGWNVEPNGNPPAGIVGAKVPTTYGIQYGSHGKALISHNEVNVSLKYGIIVGGFNIDEDNWMASDMSRVHRNTISQSRIQAGTHFANAWFSENTISYPGNEGDPCNGIVGIGSNGGGGRLWVTDNTINSSGCHGIDLHHRLIIEGMKRSTVIDGNQISNVTGPWLAAAGLGSDAGRAIRIKSGINVAEGCLTGLGGGLAFPGDVEITDNTVAAVFSGYYSLDVEADIASDHDCPGNQNKLTMSGNTLITGALDASVQSLIFGKDISAVGFDLTGPGDLVFESGSTGNCSDFIESAGAVVIDNSGNSIGDCVTVGAGGTTLSFDLPATF